MRLSPTQFDALYTLIQTRKTAEQGTHDAVRLHFVDGLSIADSARAAGAEYTSVQRAAARARRVIELVKVICADCTTQKY